MVTTIPHMLDQASVIPLAIVVLLTLFLLLFIKELWSLSHSAVAARIVRLVDIGIWPLALIFMSLLVFRAIFGAS